jgi:Tfp pilus assembly protein PilF
MGKGKAPRKSSRRSHPGWGIRLAIAVFAGAISVAACAQDNVTVRHHRVEETDPDAAKLAEAETDIGKQDYASAEPLLKDYVAAHPESYSGWYDLGYVYHGMGRSEDAIAAYRKSVAAKPDLFESNFNLGLALNNF